MHRTNYIFLLHLFMFTNVYRFFSLRKWYIYHLISSITFKETKCFSKAIGKCQGEMLFEIRFKAKTSKPSDLFLLLFLVLQLPHILWFPFRMYLKWNSRKRSKRNWNEGVLRVYAYLTVMNGVQRNCLTMQICLFVS